MKLNYIAATLFAFAIAACSEVDPYGEEVSGTYYLKTAETSVTLDGKESNSVKINANKEIEWTVTKSPEWVSISKTSGLGEATLNISTLSDNPTSSDRQGQVLLRSVRFNKQAQFNIIQKGTYITSATKQLDFKNVGSKMSLTFASNASWRVSKCPSWIKPSVTTGSGNGNISFEASANTNESVRKGTIEIEAEEASVSLDIPVTQEEVALSVSDNNILFTSASGSQAITVTSNSSWTASSDKSWCVIDKRTGSLTEKITISVSQNTGTSSVSERSATITVKSGNVSRKVTVTQSPDIQLTVGTEKMEFGPETALSNTFKVNSNASQWTVTSSQTWCKVRPTSGSNNATVTVTVDPNTGASATDREAKVTVKAGTVEKTVTIKQAAAQLKVDKDKLPFTVSKGSATVTVTSNVAWSATSDNTWCKVTVSKTSSGGTLTVNVDENPDAKDRSTTVRVNGGNIERQIIVTQKGEPKLSLGKTSIPFGKNADNTTVSVTSNVQWSAASSESWCTLSLTKTSSGGSIKISVTNNPNPTERKATISVMGEGMATKYIYVTQSGEATLEVESPSVFLPTGGTVVLKVTANVEWSCGKSSSSWCTVSKTSSGISVKVDAYSGTAERSTTFSVTGGGITRTVTVRQSGQSDINRNEFSDDKRL